MKIENQVSQNTRLYSVLLATVVSSALFLSLHLAGGPEGVLGAWSDVRNSHGASYNMVSSEPGVAWKVVGANGMVQEKFEPGASVSLAGQPVR